MKRKLLLCYVIAVSFINTPHSYSCTIFMANDGQNVWIGNNEDEAPDKEYRMWFYPAQNADNGYMIWTELAIGKLFYGLMYMNPQGGLNQYGLFMDYTAIDQIPITKDPKKENRKKQVVTDILKKCKTVDEALRFISKYNLVNLKGAQLFLGDASGNYATVTGGYIIGKTTSNFALTNYSINNGHREACWRRDIADQLLDKKESYGLGNIENILYKTAQKRPSNIITNFSMAVDLKTQKLYMYRKNDFTVKAVISLRQELVKGRHHKELAAYFPENIVPIVNKKYAQKGIDAAIQKYKELRSDTTGKYNFKSKDIITMTIPWIEKGNQKGAIKFLEMLKQYDTTQADLYTWLGVAYRKDNNIAQSDQNFKMALSLNPEDYLANLWARQENGRVTFKMNDFQGAEQVSILGDFTQWKLAAMKKENGLWIYEMVLPKGQYNYKFLVNKEYLADQINLMYTGTGPNIFSKLYVW
ncbi:hypothetical protein [Flavobacterium sp. FlaQc-48]|uniref:hypothetical protein n=1 Tax=Flavobacterium sp. FlaQc-48 TaxID=3374181 RepID=UPI003756EC83